MSPLVAQIHEAVVVAAGVEDDPLAEHVGVPLHLAVEIPAQLHYAQGLQTRMADGPELHIGSLEVADVRHDFHPAALGVDGHEAVVGVAELLIGHGHGRAVGLQMVDGVVGAGHDPADVIDGRVVLLEPVALVLELVWRCLHLHLERPAAGQERVVDAALAGVVQVGQPLPVIGGDGVVPAQPLPHGVAGLALEDAEVVQLVARLRHVLLLGIARWGSRRNGPTNDRGHCCVPGSRVGATGACPRPDHRVASSPPTGSRRRSVHRGP